jgi:hypothetical protein
MLHSPLVRCRLCLRRFKSKAPASQQKGIDAEAIKYEYLGDKAPISRFNLYKTPSGQIIISDGKNVQIPTDYFIE